MSIERIEEALQHVYPGADVHCEEQDGSINVFVICNQHMFVEDLESVKYEANRRIQRLDLQDTWPRVFVYPRHETRKILDIRQKIYRSLAPLIDNSGLHCDVDVSLERGWCSVLVSSGFFSVHEYREIAGEKVSDVLATLSEPFNLTGVTIQISDGYSNAMYGLGRNSFGSSSNDDDDDDLPPINFNWPSKTGNLSGGGRDNNPPKK